MNAGELNFACKIRHALNENIDSIPMSISDRLASARKSAILHQKKESSLRTLVAQTELANHAGKFFNQPFSWLGKLSIAAPVLLGIVLFLTLYQYEQQQRIYETADIDAAVLSDELPLSAYLDHGFNAYLAKRVE